MFARPSFLLRAVRQPSYATALRFYSEGAAPGGPDALLLKFREDLKASMRAKNTSRLNVIRALLADITNQTKALEQVSPPKELELSHVLSIIRNNIKKTEGSIEEAKKLSRQDLVDKDAAQLTVLREYLSEIKVASPEEISKAVDETIAATKALGREMNMAYVMNTAMAALEGQNPVKGDVAQIVSKKLKALRKA